MKIGNIKIDTPVFLAPMAGYTDYPFRVLCKRSGAGVVYSEFVSADGIIRENIRTLEMIQFKEEERPIGIQIFGNDPDVMATATRYINKNFSPDIIDINYGCPVPKVTKKGGGSAALKDLCLMDDITQAVVEAANETPVTVKMRAGWDLNSIIIEEAGPRIENFGVKAITLHPRTTTQKYTGKANWDLIKILKQSISIPVIGNGDIKNIDDIYDEFSYWFASKEDSPEQNINNKELKEILKKSLSFLNEKQAMLIQLYYVEELNIYEIAKILDISTGRVSQIKSSALKLIRSKIKDELN